MTQDREDAMAAGMNDHVPKPVEPKRLFSALLEWITPGARKLPESFLSLKSGAAADKTKLPDLPGIDTKTGLMRMGGNAGSYQNLLGKFAQNQSEAVDRIRESVAGNDSETATRLAHTLKGVSGNIGAMELHAVVQELETALKQNDESTQNALLEKTQSILDEVVAAIELLESPADQQAAGPAGQPNIDPEAIAALLKELLKLLQDDDTESLEVVEKLKPHLDGSRFQEQLTKMVNHIGEYDFEQAIELLQKTASELDVSLE